MDSSTMANKMSWKCFSKTNMSVKRVIPIVWIFPQDQAKSDFPKLNFVFTAPRKDVLLKYNLHFI